MKKLGVVIVVVAFVAVLYFIELGKVNLETTDSVPTLDNIIIDKAARNWDYFYRVRVNIIDGQTAEFSIPKDLKEKVGQEMEISGAAVFFSPGCTQKGDQIAVHSFFLYPTLGLANACEHLPEIAMRWTIRIYPEKDWLISRTDMIDAFVNVNGTFRVDTSKPYESAFFLDNAEVKLVSKEEGSN